MRLDTIAFMEPGEYLRAEGRFHMHSKPGGIWFGDSEKCPFCELLELKSAKADYSMHACWTCRREWKKPKVYRAKPVLR